MITAETLKQLTSMGPYALATVLKISGYSGAVFKTAEFVGITNGGEFAYKVSFDEDNTLRIGKVYVKYDSVANKITADY